MYYEFKRFGKMTQNGHRRQPLTPFSGWVWTWDGRIRNASQALHSMVGEPVAVLLEWAQRNNIDWNVWENKP